MKVVRADRCRLPQAFWRAVELLGLQPTTVLRQARLPATLHHDPTAIISTAQLFRIWRAIEALSGDAGFGIKMVRETSTATHKLAFLAASYAESYRDGIARLVRFKLLCSPDELLCDEKNGRAVLTIEWPPDTEPEPALAVDASFAMLIELGRRGTGQALSPVGIEFERAGPSTDLHDAFFGCPIRFEASKNRLILASADLDRRFIDHNPELLHMLTPALSEAMRDLESGSSFVDQVKSVLKRAMASGRPEVDDVARDMGMSKRTLQRRITAEGMTFRSLLDEARHELGIQLLADPTIRVEEVAWFLGYRDTNSFYRAFKAWTGMTPMRWRQTNELAAWPASLGTSPGLLR
ncbi:MULTISPECIES: AraC family transcriptional regulator [unclassified Rhizobium]|uniref:AraC family transcriptional regulator n=1 Tax=unclassified Rhizobium TaxID=2613769 RepID=UPI000CDF42E0|nr:MULTISPECIES: AraC family transcriptional regulator [Rhizobium]AVA21812.1 AraC family transcriptional regulator protein [Rhizobium sp. NXC24]UWU22865.1 AraC family transcriptional regulator [Rhizobium tropici]